MHISDWSSDVALPICWRSGQGFRRLARITIRIDDDLYARLSVQARNAGLGAATYCRDILERFEGTDPSGYHARFDELHATAIQRSEEHTSELQSLMRNSYAVFCLNKKQHTQPIQSDRHHTAYTISTQ